MLKLILTLQDDRVATLWLNDAAVRTAIHAAPVSDVNFICYLLVPNFGEIILFLVMQ